MLCRARGLNIDKALAITFLKRKCMHKNCLLGKAVDLSTIC